MKCTVCNESLTLKQIKIYYFKHGKKQFPPRPVCSMQCRGTLQRAPIKSKRKEHWAQKGNHDY